MSTIDIPKTIAAMDAALADLVAKTESIANSNPHLITTFALQAEIDKLLDDSSEHARKGENEAYSACRRIAERLQNLIS